MTHSGHSGDRLQALIHGPERAARPRCPIELLFIAENGKATRIIFYQKTNRGGASASAGSPIPIALFV
jgi:hypothetical protein